MTEIKKVLIANRGEIAVRVAKAARKLGISTVAIYSDADKFAFHTSMADQAVRVGTASVRDSYLNIEAILEAAKSTGADAIHPGYGFLSENAEFSRRCADLGLVFIGPSPESIQVMGNKAASKRKMLEAGVPCVPGYSGSDQSDQGLLAEARDIGLPVMVKAAAGGGGKGMRLVWNDEELLQSIRSARSEGESSFGSGELIIEKAVIEPRHVEIQVFGDKYGNVVHLGERDCSVQRRHQKVVEEAPCPVMTDELREKMGKAAVEAARAIQYVGAGTVEFLLDAGGNFYFLEMNTRLQVEHPVTEMVTGLDLVEMQFDVAAGTPLPIRQDQLSINGHAIEVRLYAEDTENEFLPSTGVVSCLRLPEGEGVRVDLGVAEGQEVTPFYDPMLAKLICHGKDRATALKKLVQALRNTSLIGLKNNREFLIEVLQKEEFRRGEATTAFIEKHFDDDGYTSKEASFEEKACAAVLQYLISYRSFNKVSGFASSELAGWGSVARRVSHFQYDEEAGNALSVRYSADDNTFTVDSDNESVEVAVKRFEPPYAVLIVNGQQEAVHFATPSKGAITVDYSARSKTFVNSNEFTKGDESIGGGLLITAPMHGNIVDVLVSIGDRIEAGQALIVMEAMKMEHQLRAELSGVVDAIHVQPSEQVESNKILIELREGSKE